MQKLLFIILSVLLFSCQQNRKQPGSGKDSLVFKAFISPAFIERAEVTLTKTGDNQKMDFLLMEIERNDRRSDTFYYKSIDLSKGQFDSLNYKLVQKTFAWGPEKPKVSRDGIYFDFRLVRDQDTSSLYLDNPFKGDAGGYQIAKNAIDHFRWIFKDSVINDYLDDAESYIDHSKPGIKFRDDRAINRLRKIEFGFRP